MRSSHSTNTNRMLGRRPGKALLMALVLIAGLVVSLLGPTAAPALADDTGWSNPSAQAFDTGGDGDGFEINPTGAYTNGSGNAENENGPGDRHRYYNYGFSIPAGSTIDGIEVRLDWWLSSDWDTNSMSVELSRDGGTSWTSPKNTTTEPTSEATTILGGPTDTWGQTWTVAQLSNANFRVRITCNCSGVVCGYRDYYLDWVPVRLYYTPANPAYTIDKTVSDVGGEGASGHVDAAGDVISYQVVVTNTGNLSLTGVTLDDDLVALVGSPSESMDPDDILQVGETWTWTYTYTATQADIDNNGGGDGDIDNTATVDCTQLDGQSDSAAVLIDQEPDYTIDKTVTDVDGEGASGHVDEAGDVISYRVEVENTGNQTLTGVTVSDPLVTNLTRQADEVGNDDNYLEVGEIWVYTGTYTATQDDIDNNGGGDGDIDNTATVDCTQLDGQSDSAAVLIDGNAAINVDKSSTTTTITTAGQVVPYSFLVTNGGNVTLTGITVSDPDCDAAPAYQSGDDGDNKLQTTETWTYTCSHTVTQAEMDAGGNLSNTVTADSNESEGDAYNYNIPITQNLMLSVEKTGTFDAGADGYADPGELISYQFKVTNTSNVTLHYVLVTDPKVATITCPSGNPIPSLAVGASDTCTGSYAVTQADINAGSVHNVGTADSRESGPASDASDLILRTPPAYEPEFVPEAGTMWLLGSGLMGLAGYASLSLRARRKSE